MSRRLCEAYLNEARGDEVKADITFRHDRELMLQLPDNVREELERLFIELDCTPTTHPEKLSGYFAALARVDELTEQYIEIYVDEQGVKHFSIKS